MSRKTFKKIITTPELVDKINPQNKKLMKLYLKDKDRKCSEATMKVYTSDLNIFFVWNELENENKFYPDIKKIEISAFFDYLVDEMKVNGKRFAHFKSVLSGLSDCVIRYFDEEYPTFRNFISAVVENIPKNDAREKTIIEVDEFKSLLNYLTSSDRIQEACLLACAGYSGMRISELEQMRVSFISEDSLGYSGLFYKTTKKMRTKGRSKDGKQICRYILHDAFKPYFEAWIKERKKILEDKEVEDHDMLFLNKLGNPASQDVLRTFISKWEKFLGKNLYAHSLRHFFTTMLKSEYQCSDAFVKAVVQWESIDMVSVYSDIDEEDAEWEEIENMKNMLKNEQK